MFHQRQEGFPASLSSLERASYLMSALAFSARFHQELEPPHFFSFCQVVIDKCDCLDKVVNVPEQKRRRHVYFFLGLNLCQKMAKPEAYRRETWELQTERVGPISLSFLLVCSRQLPDQNLSKLSTTHQKDPARKQHGD